MAGPAPMRPLSWKPLLVFATLLLFAKLVTPLTLSLDDHPLYSPFHRHRQCIHLHRGLLTIDAADIEACKRACNDSSVRHLMGISHGNVHSVTLSSGSRYHLALPSASVNAGIDSRFHSMSVADSDSAKTEIEEEFEWFVHMKFPLTPSAITDVNAALKPYTLGAYMPHATFSLVAPESVATTARYLHDVLFVARIEPDWKYHSSLINELMARRHSDGSEGYHQLRIGLTRSAIHSPPHPSQMSTVWLASHWQHYWANGTDSRSVRFSVIDAHHVKAQVPYSLAQTHSNTSSTLQSFIDWLASQSRVSSISVIHTFTTLNKHARFVTQTDRIGVGHHYETPAFDLGLNGSNVVVALGDTGVDYDSCFFHDPYHPTPVNSVNREHRKIITYITVPDQRRQDKALAAPGDHFGHGTHTAGSVAGSVMDPMVNNQTVKSSVLSELSKYNGMAPAAKLVIHDFLVDGDPTLYVPESVYDEYLSVIVALGAHISSNSWGDDSGLYDAYSADVDRFLFGHPNHLMVMAAGNEGAKGLSTIGTPACAKNVLTVGASLNHPDSFSELGFNTGMLIVEPSEISGNVRLMPADFGLPWFEQSLRVNLSIVIARPVDGCRPLEFVNAANKVVIVARGQCKYYTKAKHVEQAGGVAMIVVNDIDGAAVQMTTDDNAPDLTIASAMIDRAHGQSLIDPITFISVRLTFPMRFDSSDFDENQLSSWSSRGPTQDGRLKPDLVAPGESIQSAATSNNLNDHQCYAPQRKDKRSITAMDGTSMATPIVAGTAALVRQFFVDGKYRPPTGTISNIYDGPLGPSVEPSSSLLKAILVHGTVPITGKVHQQRGQSGITVNPTDQVQVQPPPSVYQGHGRIQLDQVINFPIINPVTSNKEIPFQLFVDDYSKLNSLAQARYCFRVNDGSSSSSSRIPLKATLVWIDPPGSTHSSFILVNEFDLIVQRVGSNVSNSETWIGNDRSREDRTPMQWDANNNVEKVTVPAPAPGLYQVIVRATHIPSHTPQPYSVVVTGDYSVFNNAECPVDVYCPNHCSGHGRCVTQSCHSNDDVLSTKEAELKDQNMTVQAALVNNGQCECDPHWAGADCSARSIAVKPGEPPIEAVIPANQWIYFSYDAPANIQAMTFTVIRTSDKGDPDFYLTSPLRPGVPTLDYYHYKDTEYDPKMKQPPTHVLAVDGDSARGGHYMLGVWGYCCDAPAVSLALTVVIDESKPSVSNDGVSSVKPSERQCGEDSGKVIALNQHQHIEPSLPPASVSAVLSSTASSSQSLSAAALVAVRVSAAVDATRAALNASITADWQHAWQLLGFQNNITVHLITMTSLSAATATDGTGGHGGEHGGSHIMQSESANTVSAVKLIIQSQELFATVVDAERESRALADQARLVAQSPVTLQHLQSLGRLQPNANSSFATCHLTPFNASLSLLLTSACADASLQSSIDAVLMETDKTLQTMFENSYFGHLVILTAWGDLPAPALGLVIGAIVLVSFFLYQICCRIELPSAATAPTSSQVYDSTDSGDDEVDDGELLAKSVDDEDRQDIDYFVNQLQPSDTITGSPVSSPISSVEPDGGLQLLEPSLASRLMSYLPAPLRSSRVEFTAVSQHSQDDAL